ncbi:uncharacterized protein LOC142913361 isoform X2 [Petromyzon marinus]|uniref:uncharacterized protein LOC142913361 isoform X2 n=1 Tax=Petromyzon marinus TaxID=7757 RepID=UPI003F70480A
MIRGTERRISSSTTTTRGHCFVCNLTTKEDIAQDPLPRHLRSVALPSEGSRQADHLPPPPPPMETFHTTTRLVALLVVVLGDRHNPFALPLDPAVIISGHVRYQRSSHQVYAAKQQPPDTRRKASPPSMLTEPDRMYRAREGEAVYMECSVWPPATILWFRNYRSLKVKGERFQIFENGTLRILDLRREDTDTYTCFATNNLNSDQLRAHLSVEVAPGGEEEDEEEDEDEEDEEEDEEGDEEEDEEEDEKEEDEEEGQDDGKEASTSSPSAPNAGSGRDGGADEGEDDDDELLATSPAAMASSAAATTSVVTTSAGRASATSKASCCPGAAWPTALLLALVPSLARGGDV